MNRIQKIAADLSVGDYLAEYRRGDNEEYSDSELAELRRHLAARGLVLATDGFGVRVVTEEPADDDR